MLVEISYPGILSDGLEFAIPLASTDAVEFTRLAPGCVQPPGAGGLVFRIQNEPGSNPSEFIQALVPEGNVSGSVATGSVTATGQLWVRVIDANGAEWLRSQAMDDTDATQETVTLELRYPGILEDGLEWEQQLPYISSVEFSRLSPGVLTAPMAGDLVFRLQDVAGTSPGSFIEARVGIGQSVGPIASGSVPATSSVWVRVVEGGGAAWMNSSASNEGRVEAVAFTLCTLQDVKAFLGKNSTADDATLLLQLEGTSEEMVGQIGFAWSETVSLEKHFLTGVSEELRLRKRPVESVTEIRWLGSVQDLSNFHIEKETGVIRHRWGRWSGEVEVTYTAGYAQPPRELRNACMIQTAYAWSLSQPGGGRLGDSAPGLPTGGGGYVVDDWHPQVAPVIERWRHWEA